MNTFDIIKNRRSVRTFDATPLKSEDLNNISEFLATASNPFEIPIEWTILDANEHKLSSPVIVGTDTYIAGKVDKVLHAEEAFGYSFERIVLYASAMGVGTTWIAGTLDRKAFEKAVGLKEGEVMPCVSPLGYEASRMSLRENMMRKGVKADSRMEFEKLFFAESFEKPLSKEEAGVLYECFEGVRLAPSAVNRQPWRAVMCGDKIHFYEYHSKGYINDGWDVQKIDMGIALCHFDLLAKEKGIEPALSVDEPSIKTEDNLEYIATFTVSKKG